MQIIVTDLTRFKADKEYCTAGIDPKTGICIRPMPYLTSAFCRKLNILPGSILGGSFIEPPNLHRPHVEDRRCNDLEYRGPSTTKQFLGVLTTTSRPSVEQGFAVKLDKNQKHIPADQAPNISIITIEVEPDSVQVQEDKYDKTKVKLMFADRSGKDFRYIPITDLGFHSYAQSLRNKSDGLERVNDFIQSQDRVFLRIGLSRVHVSQDGRTGYWIQANGIYTFPNFLTEIGCHR